MTLIEAVVLDAADPQSAGAFYAEAFGLGDRVGVRGADVPASGFRGFTLSLLVAQPSVADQLIDEAVRAGAAVVKPAARSLWGYGGAVQAPDGSIWKVASSSKKDKGPAERRIDDIVLLLGVVDVKASKAFYVERGLAVKRSFGGKYAEFEAADGAIKLALYGRRALAKDAGVDAAGPDAHGLTIIADGDAAFTDPDGFAWGSGAARRGSAVPEGAGQPS